MVRQVLQLLGVCLAIVAVLVLMGKMTQVWWDVMAKWGRVEMFSRRHPRRTLALVLAILIAGAIYGLIFFVFVWPIIRPSLR